MVAKVALVLAVLAIVLIAAVIAAFLYFKEEAEHRHEKEMFREKRDAQILTEETDSIDRELQREKDE